MDAAGNGARSLRCTPPSAAVESRQRALSFEGSLPNQLEAHSRWKTWTSCSATGSPIGETAGHHDPSICAPSAASAVTYCVSEGKKGPWPEDLVEDIMRSHTNCPVLHWVDTQGPGGHRQLHSFLEEVNRWSNRHIYIQGGHPLTLCLKGGRPVTSKEPRPRSCTCLESRCSAQIVPVPSVTSPLAEEASERGRHKNTRQCFLSNHRFTWITRRKARQFDYRPKPW